MDLQQTPGLPDLTAFTVSNNNNSILYGTAPVFPTPPPPIIDTLQEPSSLPLENNNKEATLKPTDVSPERVRLSQESPTVPTFVSIPYNSVSSDVVLNDSGIISHHFKS